jgi:hypothetical protein
MQVRNVAFKRGNAMDWNRERIERLTKQEMEQLKANAERLGESTIVELCVEALKTQRKVTRKGAVVSPVRVRARRLISRAKAFEARGVSVQDPAHSWGGVRKSDGKVVLTMWNGAVEADDSGGCSYLLWAPNVDGARPWADMPAGKERIEHCMLAVKNGAEGLLVFGERLDGHLPEEKARTIHGVDPETVLVMKVQKRGEEYWATWGKKETVEA